jgi:hypothetical protein
VTVSGDETLRGVEPKRDLILIDNPGAIVKHGQIRPRRFVGTMDFPESPANP